ncbi:MAG: helix-turn-helix transcriptional regulator, partial [Chloroflexi bacterium]
MPAAAAGAARWRQLARQFPAGAVRLSELLSERLSVDARRRDRYVLAPARTGRTVPGLDARWDRVDFAELLRWHRQRLGLSQAQLAATAGLAVRTIRSVELGQTRRPRQDSMRLLADALGLTNGAREAFEASAAGTCSPVHAGVRARVAPSQLPPDLPDFSGRTEEVAAATALVASRPVVVVSGPVGIGKTTLAVHVGHELKATCPDGHLYADLGGSACPVRPEE